MIKHLLNVEQAIALARLTHVTQPAAGVLHLPLESELEAAKCGWCREFSLDWTGKERWWSRHTQPAASWSRPQHSPHTPFCQGHQNETRPELVPPEWRESFNNPYINSFMMLYFSAIRLVIDHRPGISKDGSILQTNFLNELDSEVSRVWPVSISQSINVAVYDLIKSCRLWLGLLFFNISSRLSSLMLTTMS